MADRGPASDPKHLFVCIAEPVDNPPKLDVSEEDHHKEHVAFLQGLFDRGLLLGSGPREDPAKKRYGGAVIILQNVDSLEEARAIVTQEPNIRDGQRTVSISPWRRMWFGDNQPKT